MINDDTDTCIASTGLQSKMKVVVSGARVGSFVQARYVHWRIVGKCPTQKNTLVVVQLFMKVQYSYLIQFLVSG